MLPNLCNKHYDLSKKNLFDKTKQFFKSLNLFEKCFQNVYA